MNEHERNAADPSTAERPAADLPVARHLGLVSSAAGDMVLERALSEVQALEGGTLLVVAGMPGRHWWPSLPRPWVLVASIEEAKREWPRRVYEVVLIDWDVPNEGVEELCARAQGVAVCVRFAYSPTTGLERSWALGEHYYHGQRWLELGVDPSGTVLVDLGDFPRVAEWRECASDLMRELVRRSDRERKRCKEAGDRVSKHAASVRAGSVAPDARPPV